MGSTAIALLPQLSDRLSDRNCDEPDVRSDVDEDRLRLEASAKKPDLVLLVDARPEGARSVRLRASSHTRLAVNKRCLYHRFAAAQSEQVSEDAKRTRDGYAALACRGCTWTGAGSMVRSSWSASSIRRHQGQVSRHAGLRIGAHRAE